MEQVSFYDFFPKQNDPLYLTLEKLTTGDSVQLGEFTVTLNKFGIYEITSEQIHEAKDSLDACYQHLNQLGKGIDL